MKRIITLFTALALILSICLPVYAAPASAAEPVRAASSLTPVKISAPDPTYKDESYSYAERAVDLVSRMTEQEMISQTEGYNAPAIARLGVATYMWWNEALHGYNQEGWFGIQTDGSSFPSSYSMGASWDPKIYYQEAVQIGAEIRERVKQNRYNLTMFSPTINLGRDPRWGRNDEGYGEDPFVTGMLASSFVNGVEGKTIDGEFIRTNANGEGVKQAGTTIKHYAANNSEKNRYTSGADNVTVREMREYYTRAARIVTKNADVSSVMMAYSSVSGFPISFSSYYMDTVLRQTYGFSGYIVSDCDSVAVSYNRSVHKNNPFTGENYTKGEAFANALANGLDLQCNAGETDSLGSYASNYSQLLAEPDGSPVQTDKGYFTKQQAEVSVARLMTQRMKLGEFDEDNFYATEGKARLDAGNAGNYVNGVAGQTQERIDLADELSRATIVLLQNEDKALPITAAEINAADGYDVAIVGPVGQSNFRGGYSSTLRNEANVVTIEQAIKTAFADTETYPQATVDNVNIAYYYGFSSNVNRNSFTGLRSDQIAIDDVAEGLDLAIVVVGQGSGDSREDGDRTDLNLAQAQVDLVKAVKAKNPKKLILVMETYGPIQMVSDLTEGVDAILWSGFNGFRKGTGFGEAITGKNNPSGRMNATWLKDMIADTPGFFDYSLFPVDGNGGRTYMYNVEDTIYPFGFGLSYSDFQYAANGSILGAASKGGLVLGTADAPITKDSTIDVSFQIKNNSAVPGKQVAEVYVVSPGAGTNNYPLKRLVGFDKVEVGANDTADVTIPVQVTDFAFFNEEKDCYELPTGTWQIWVAFSSDLNEATDLVESFTVQNGAIREDPTVVTVKPTQPGDSEKGISERVLFDLTTDPAKNVIDPGVAVTMANEKLYGVRVVKNVPGVDIGVDPAAATEAGGDFANPDTAAALPRLQAGKSADELPHIGTKFVLPDDYKVDYSSNRPEVVAVEDGRFVMKGIGVATLTVTVTAPSGASASEEFTVGVQTAPGLESITVGETKYKKFDPSNYGVNVAVPVGTRVGAPGLEVSAVAAEGATVEYLSKDADGNFVPNETRSPATLPGTVYVRVTGDGLIDQIYEVNFAESEAVKPAGDGEYVLASSIEVGKTYVVVADEAYALTNRQEGPALRSYAGGATTSLASAPVVVTDGKIASTVNNDMLWTVEESTAPAAYDGQTQYFLKDASGNYLRRGSGSSGQGAQLLAEPNLYSNIRYNAFSFYPYEDGSGYAMYANSERAYGTDYPFYVYGNETTFDSPGRAQRDEADPFAFTRNDDCSHITLYEYAPIVGGGENIDFTNPADEPKYAVVNQETYALVEGTGVKLTPTAFAFEPVSSGCGGSAEDSTPRDLIRVPVKGDWTATLNLEYNPNDAATAASSYYAFMAMAGEEYQDLAGIRGTGTASQDFLRQEGVTMDPVAPGAGFTDAGLYWVRLQKDGTTYIASISTDGAEYTELFEIEDTGVEAEYIVLDAYKTASSSWGSQAVWDITLKSLTFGEGSVTPGPTVDKSALRAAIAEAAEVAKDEYTADSVAALEAAVAAAEAVRDKADATQEEVDDAAQAVRDAIAALVKEDKADTTALEAAIAAAEAVERDKYTDASLAALDAALAEARTTLAESRLQAVIDTAAQALNDAIAALEPKPVEPPADELKLGPNVVKDPESPTGYTVKFLYDNDEVESVTFNGDISLKNDADRSDTATYTPFEYKPGYMRAAGFNAPMEKRTFTIDGEENEVWYYEVPLSAGANQYWYTLPGSSRMQPDPHNPPYWSPNSSATKDAYNIVYVPYDEKQDYEPTKAREAECPRTDGKSGVWDYYPIEFGGRTHYMGIYTPYGYVPKGARAEGGPYKLIFMLHGMGQDESDWMGIGSVQKIMDNLVAEGKTEPAVIVSVTSNNSFLGTNGSNIDQYVLPYLYENYNVSTDPMDQAWAGLSMGSSNTQSMINANASRFGWYGCFSLGNSVTTTNPALSETHILFGDGTSDFGALSAAQITAVDTICDNGGFARFERVTGGHDFNTWCQLFRIWCEDYLWKPAAFGDTDEPVELETAALEAKIAEAEAIDTTPYTDSSVANLAKAIAAAKDALETAKRQRQIDDALAALENAINRLKVKPSPSPDSGYVLASEPEPGKSYVIVADDEYALSQEDGAAIAAEVTVSGDKITSAVSDEMVWTFDVNDSLGEAADGSVLYVINDAEGNFLRRSSGALAAEEYAEGNINYYGWSFIEREEGSGVFTFYNNSNRGNSYRYAVTIGEAGVSNARVSASSGNILASGSAVKLYEKVGTAGGLSGIDFTDPADASKYDIVNKDTAEVVEGTGITLTPTADAFEPIGGGFGGGDPTPSEPKDLILVPVNGDWTGILQVEFDQNEVTFAMSSYFSLLAMAGDDYQNMAGIRGTNNVFQDYLRQDGTIAAATVAAPGWQDTPTSGFTANGTYWLKLEKEGDTYIGSWSADGGDFTELFRLEDTGIEADYIVIDAYKTSTFSFGGDNNWLFTLKNLELEGGGTPAVQLNKKALRQAIRDAGAVVRKYYTEETLAAMDAALESAKDALANATTQAALDAAAEALNAAIAALERTPNLPKYDVTFDFNYPGAPDPVVVQVEDGQTVEPIEAPARPGYAFSYWGTERSSGWGGTSISRFDFNTPITDALTLKASWTKDWNQMYSLAEEYADYFPFGNFGTQSPSTTSVNQVTREYNTYSGNSGKMTYNFGENQSKAAYDAAVEEINARTDISDAEKAELIKEADGKVLLGDSNPLASSLNAIRTWNEEHPEGPKKYFRQHVLFWHGSEQNPAFYHEGFDRNKPLVSKEVMNARIDSYVEAMFKRYQEWDDVILSWDVVNEALDDYNGMVRNGWNGSSWGETMLDDASNQSSAWGTIYRMKDADGNPVMELSDERLMYESEWIREAFASAKKWKEELGVHWTLYYNDYMNSSMLYEPKVSNTLKMLKPISEAGNLEGYGMQARLATAYPDAELLRWQIEEGLKLAPEVSFSEGDVRTDFEVNPKYDPSKPTRRVQEGDEEYDEGGSGSWSRRSQQNGNTYDVSNGPVRRRENFNANDPDIMREQADYYADLMDIMLEKADLGKVGAIAIDGTSDGNTFNRNTGCQIWDSSSNEKPAFYAVIGAPNRHKMGKAIAAGPAVSEEAKYTAETWAPYAAALKAAEDLVDVRIYDAAGVEAVKAATAALIEATENLELSGVGPIPADLEELYRLAREALERAKAAQAAAEEALAAAEAAGGIDTEALEAAKEAAQAAQAAAQEAMIQAAAAQEAAEAADRDAAAQAAAAARDAAYAAEQAAAAARANAAAQRAQAAAEAAQAAAEAAQANTAADKTAAEAAKEAAQAAQAAAEAAKEAAHAADLEAAERAAASAASAAEAARAQAAAQAAQAAAEAAEKAAQEAQAKADQAAANAAADAAAAKAAKEAAEAAKAAAENAKALAEAAKDAAAASNATAAEAAAQAADAAAQVADARQQVAAAQAEIAELKAQADASAAAAEAAKKAAEEAQKAAEAAKLGAAKYQAKAKLANFAVTANVPEDSKSAFDAAMADAMKAVDDADDEEAVKKALDDALKALQAIIENTAEPFRFDDVKDETMYYYDPVYWAYEREPQITTGTSDKLFSPDAPCTRAQVVTFLWRAANQPEPKTASNPFVDVAADAYYAKAVLWAVENGITKGTTATTFRPDQICTRGQIMTFLWRYLGEPAPKGANPFADVAADAYYADAIAWGAENNIARGITPTEFRPDQTCTRAQIVTFLYRAMP